VWLRGVEGVLVCGYVWVLVLVCGYVWVLVLVCGYVWVLVYCPCRASEFLHLVRGCVGVWTYGCGGVWVCGYMWVHVSFRSTRKSSPASFACMCVWEGWLCVRETGAGPRLLLLVRALLLADCVCDVCMIVCRFNHFDLTIPLSEPTY